MREICSRCGNPEDHPGSCAGEKSLAQRDKLKDCEEAVGKLVEALEHIELYAANATGNSVRNRARAALAAWRKVNS